MLSNKRGVRDLVEICSRKGIKEVIIAPGSRNAPLVISFAEHGHFNCLSIPDERVAGFFALGIAQQTRRPVIITCTSGTAALNFAPAIAEAFYQKIPLLVITADRPVEWINQGEGQSIQQRNVFANYIKRSYELPQEAQDTEDTEDTEDLWSNSRIICEAIDQTLQPSAGPVHLNIPFREPLYEVTSYKSTESPKIIESLPIQKTIGKNTLKELTKEWNQLERKIILCGALPTRKSNTLNKLISKISKDPSVVVFTENTSNLCNKRFFDDYDSMLSTIAAEEGSGFKPDLLITIGGSFISKRIKKWVRKNTAKAHWHIEELNFYLDTFQSLTRAISIAPTPFFQQLIPNIKANKSHYQKLWRKRAKKVARRKAEFFDHIAWSDLSAFKVILSKLPKNTNLHLGNSTPARYAQLFSLPKGISINSNRGVAGIDGATSTAVGAAFISGKPTTIITGDISFFYDSNALWHHHLPPNLRIILINNKGGNIFRFIKGPDSTNQLSNYFEAYQEQEAKYIAQAHNLNYFVASDEKRLKEILPQFYSKQPNNRPALLEIHTPRVESANTWRDYYNFIAR